MPAIAQADETLTDEQVQQMLARATQRLKGRSTALAKKSDAPQYTFPKLNTGELVKPYLSTSGDVVSADSKRMLEKKERTMANGLRRIEDPVTQKKAAEEVCNTCILLMNPWP